MGPIVVSKSKSLGAFAVTLFAAIYLYYCVTANFSSLDSDIQYYIEYFYQIKTNTTDSFLEKLKIYTGSNDVLFGAISEGLGVALPERLVLWALGAMPTLALIGRLLTKNSLNKTINNALILGIVSFEFHNAFLNGPFHYLRYHVAMFVFIALFFLVRGRWLVLISSAIHLSTVVLVPASVFRHSAAYLRFMIFFEGLLLVSSFSGISLILPSAEYLKIFEYYATYYGKAEDAGLLKYYVIALILQLSALRLLQTDKDLLALINLLATATFVTMALNYISPSGLLAARFSPVMVFSILATAAYLCILRFGHTWALIFTCGMSAIFAFYYSIPYLASNSVDINI